MINHWSGASRAAQTGMWRRIRGGSLGAQLSISSTWSCCIPTPPARPRRAEVLDPLWGRPGFGSKRGVRSFRSDNSSGESLHFVRDPRVTITGAVMPLTSPGERSGGVSGATLGTSGAGDVEGQQHWGSVE